MIDSITNKTQPEAVEKKPACFFTACDTENFKYAIPFFKSMVKFHDPKKIDMLCFTTENRKEELAKLPQGITVIDLTPHLQDQMFWFRQKPILSESLLDKYDLVVGFDSDQLIVGDLNYILETTDYDVGTVINWNRWDEKFYPHVAGWGIFPAEYFNCGLVALRSKKFAHNWLVNCYTPQFDRLQYKEQDILNALCYYGNYNVRCFDHPDPVKKNFAWYGILGKGEWNRAILQNKKIIVPKGLGNTPFPPTDIEIKVIHMGGGKEAKKDNWAAFFSPEVYTYITTLIK